MALIDITDIQNEMGITFSTTTTPKSTTVSDIITRVIATIQGYIRERYGDIDDITDAEALNVLRDIAITLAVGKINRIIKEIRRLTAEEEETTTSGINEAMKRLRDIRDGKLLLGEAASNASSGVKYDNDNMGITFEKDEDEW